MTGSVGGHGAAIVTVLLLALVACGGEPPVATVPSPVVPTTSVRAPPTGPASEAARDLRGFVARPCDLLTPEQAARLGLRGPGPLRVQGGPPVGCGWLLGSGTAVGELHLSVAERDLLAEAYRGYTPMPWRALTPTQVGDLPAVTVAPLDTYVRCELTVRTDAAQGFTVSVRQSSREVPQACGLAREVADAVVAGLPRRP